MEEGVWYSIIIFIIIFDYIILRKEISTLNWIELNLLEYDWAELSWAELSWTEQSCAELSRADVNWIEYRTGVDWTMLLSLHQCLLPGLHNILLTDSHMSMTQQKQENSVQYAACWNAHWLITVLCLFTIWL